MTGVNPSVPTVRKPRFLTKSHSRCAGRALEQEAATGAGPLTMFGAGADAKSRRTSGVLDRAEQATGEAMDIGAGGVLLLLGAVSIIAALVGGNVKLPGNTEFPALKSIFLRIPLGIIGGLFFLYGLALVVGINEETVQESTLNERPAYVARVNEICGRRVAEMASLPAAPEGDRLGIADAHFRAAQVLAEWRDEMLDVPQPKDDEAHLSQLFQAMTAMAYSMRAASEAAARDDRPSYDQNQSTFTESEIKFNGLASSYGLQRCRT